MVEVPPPDVEEPPQRRPRVPAWLGVAALVVAAVAFGWWLRGDGGADPRAVPVGNASEFGVGTAVAVELDAPHYDPVGVEDAGPGLEVPPGRRDGTVLFVVNHPDQGLLALSQRGPYRGCRIQAAVAAEAEEFGRNPPTSFVLGFIDPCHGGLYDLDGTHLEGPGNRNLDRFPVGYLPDGTVTVDLTRLTASTAP